MSLTLRLECRRDNIWNTWLGLEERTVSRRTKGVSNSDGCLEHRARTRTGVSNKRGSRTLKGVSNKEGLELQGLEEEGASNKNRGSRRQRRALQHPKGPRTGGLKPTSNMPGSEVQKRGSRTRGCRGSQTNTDKLERMGGLSNMQGLSNRRPRTNQASRTPKEAGGLEQERGSRINGLERRGGVSNTQGSFEQGPGSRTGGDLEKDSGVSNKEGLEQEGSQHP